MTQHRPTAFNAWIDLFRWSAALCVLWTHTGLRMLRPAPQLEHLTAARAAYAFVAGFDHYAVMVFFVLSGYLVGGSLIAEQRRSGRIAFGRYLFRRLLRLCVVLWPAYALIWLLDHAAVQLGAIQLGLFTPAVLDSLSPSTLACNMAFLQMAACVQYGENGALWSLFNEAWYYVLFPLLLIALAGAASRSIRLACAALFLALIAGLTLLQFEAARLAPYMLIWLLGAVVAAARKPAIPSVLLAGGLLTGTLLAIRLLVRSSFVQTHPVEVFLLDLLVSALFANLLLAMRHRSSLRMPPGGVQLHQALASFSFSNYCVHIPVLTLYISTIAVLTGAGTDLAGDRLADWAKLFGALAVCILSAFVYSRCTEAHTDRLRTMLSRGATLSPEAVTSR